MTTALLIVDIQNDYFPGGKMELEGSVPASENARRLLEHFRQANMPTIHVQHISTRPGATFFLPETEGVQIHANVRPRQGEVLVQKHFPTAFRETELLNCLQERQVKRLVVCGMMTHMCIDATTRAATDLGFDCLIAGDACATRALRLQGQTVPAEYVHRAFLAALDGSYGQVMSTEAVLAQLKDRSGLTAGGK